ncbi:hypothetical protein NDU88_006244 [Pleurodeles waltl]|uniref:Uncharacterized protein n=1 Tax=Pleurodeles waltl TaxID=8319 RepID=A0AAV7UKH7_PLEWA|nr:hypothetical protein NDU88_006244 [Pleurodeles waltl]
MMKDKRSKPQVNKIINFTQPVPPDGQDGEGASAAPSEKPDGAMDTALFLAAVKNSSDKMVHKIGYVARHVNLLQTDLHKVVDDVTTLLQQVDFLQQEVHNLRDTIINLQKLKSRLDDQMEYPKG